MKTFYSALALLALSGSALAQSSPVHTPGETFGATLLLIVVGLVVMGVSALITDMMTPGKLVEELKGKNMALALVTGGALIADAVILCSVLGGWSQADHSALFRFVENDLANLIANGLLYALIGIIFRWVGYIIFDKCTPSLDFGRELKEERNVALGIVIACGFVATAWFISGPLAG